MKLENMAQLFRTLLFIGILLGPLKVLGNDTTKVVLPYWVAVKVFSELKERDNLVIVLNKQDSIITLYEQKTDGLEVAVKQLKLQAKDYKKIVVKLEDVVEIQKRELLDVRRKYRRNKQVSKIVGVVALIEMIALIIL